MTPSILQRLIILIASAMLLASCGNVKFTGFSTEKVGSDGTNGDGIHDDSGGPTPTPSPGTSPTATPPGGSSPTPTPTPTGTPRTVTYSEVVPANPNKVDILLVIDDSGSMKTDQLKLASKLSGFANLLESQSVPMDWQMCVTVTRSQLISNNYYWGASVNWVGYSPAAGTPQYVLKKGTSNLNNIFTQTINAIGAGVPGSGDERGIKAAYHHFYNGEPGVAGTSGCYRSGAAVSVIVISDEDERSVGGDCSRIKTNMNEDPKTCLPLEAADMPNNLLSQAKTVFGTNVRFTFNSIVVADSACEKIQDETPDELNQRSPSHQGTKYIETSHLTNGGVGSICADDFSTNLNLFKDKILNSVSSLTLECAPVSGTLVVAIDGVNTTAYTLNGANLKFTNAVVEGKRVTMTYKCNP
ncbi:MAG: hypothetical protein JSU04_07030 [Bdellovibrionales bacterium]|nr:hypothetical protein [Bdellovibrionales bacterium]